jgi:hypothetical protein
MQEPDDKRVEKDRQRLGNAYLPAVRPEELERELVAGLDSGKPIEVTPEYWERVRRDLIARHITNDS